MQISKLRTFEVKNWENYDAQQDIYLFALFMENSYVLICLVTVKHY